MEVGHVRELRKGTRSVGRKRAQEESTAAPFEGWRPACLRLLWGKGFQPEGTAWEGDPGLGRWKELTGRSSGREE